MTKELLRVTLSPERVKEACIEWARSRVSGMEKAGVSVEGVAEGKTVEVVFTQKRVRKAKGEK